MNDKELKQWIADQVKEAVTEQLASKHGFTVIDITPTELSIRVIKDGGPKYYRVKVIEAT